MHRTHRRKHRTRSVPCPDTQGASTGPEASPTPDTQGGSIGLGTPPARTHREEAQDWERPLPGHTGRKHVGLWYPD